MANSVDPDQTAPIGAVCSGFTLFASILKSSVMLGYYLQQTTLADVIFQMHFLFGALKVKHFTVSTQQRATISPPAKRHLNGVSLADLWWPEILCCIVYDIYI